MTGPKVDSLLPQPPKSAFTGRTDASAEVPETAAVGSEESNAEAELAEKLSIPVDKFQQVSGLRVSDDGPLEGLADPGDAFYRDEGGKLERVPDFSTALGIYVDALENPPPAARGRTSSISKEERDAWKLEFKAGCAVARRHHKRAYWQNVGWMETGPDNKFYASAVGNYCNTYEALAAHLDKHNSTAAALIRSLASDAVAGPTSRDQSKHFASFAGKALRCLKNA